MRKFLTLVTVLLLIIPALAFAADKSANAKSETKSFTLLETAQVGSVQLAPGDYKVSFNTTGDNVPVTILRGHKTVATAQANIVAADNSNNPGVAVEKDSSGQPQLTTIMLPRNTVKLSGAASPAGGSQ